MSDAETETAKSTPLTALMRRHGGKIVSFAGHALPVSFPSGIVAEHRHTREAASLFDVSHMGQIALRPRDGEIATAQAALERLVPGDILGLAPGRQRYTLLTSPEGGILDDLMAANLGDRLVLVVNAARAEADLAHIAEGIGPGVAVERLGARALLALQGPEAAGALATLCPEAPGMAFLEAREAAVAGAPAFLSRSGYTGEDGFEISLPAEAAEAVAERLLAIEAVAPAGLGARDTLRLEAGLCLHGADIGPETSPAEAALGWTVARARREGGARAGGFPGAARILAEIAEGPRRRRVGLLPEGRAPLRAGAALFAGERGAEEGGAVGRVTSGGFAPSLSRPVAMGYVPARLAAPGTRIGAELRGRRLGVEVAALPFVPPKRPKP